jgi:hypothetical protein
MLMTGRSRKASTIEEEDSDDDTDKKAISSKKKSRKNNGRNDDDSDNDNDSIQQVDRKPSSSNLTSAVSSVTVTRSHLVMDPPPVPTTSSRGINGNSNGNGNGTTSASITKPLTVSSVSVTTRNGSSPPRTTTLLSTNASRPLLNSVHASPSMITTLAVALSNFILPSLIESYHIISATNMLFSRMNR